jgi:hypothetical protein
MWLPKVPGTIKRRLLVNYRVDPAYSAICQHLSASNFTTVMPSPESASFAWKT